MAFIQVLGIDEHAHRSETGLVEELEGTPKSGSTLGGKLSPNIRNFFRMSGRGTYKISLVARHVLPRNQGGRRCLDPEMVSKLVSVALDLLDGYFEPRSAGVAEELRLPQPRQHLPKAVKPSLQVLDDLLGEFVRFRQVVQIDQALVLEPEGIEAGLVASRQFLVAERPSGASCLSQVALRRWWLRRL